MIPSPKRNVEPMADNTPTDSDPDIADTHAADSYSVLLSHQANTATSSVIRDLLRHANRPDVISLAGGIPAPALFPLERIGRASELALQEVGATAAQYGLTEGVEELRELFAADASVDRSAHPGQILVTTGSQQAIDLVGRVLIDPGDDIVVDDPAYLGALQALRGHGPNIVGIGVDGEGLDTNELENRLRAGLRPKFVYTNPNFQNPTGATLSLERREHLAGLADEFGFVIVEDDPYGALRFSGTPHPSIAKFSERVIRIQTVSKTLAPGLRVAWMISPQPIHDALVIAKQAVDLHTSTYTQHTALRLLRDRTWYSEHENTLSPWYLERRDALSAGLLEAFGDKLVFNSPEGGMFLWAELNGYDIDTTDLLDVALEHGVAFVPGSAFAVERALPNHLRLSFATASPQDLRLAARRLLAAVEQLAGRSDR